MRRHDAAVLWLLEIDWRPAEPAAEELEQQLTDRRQVLTVHRADAGGAGIGIHDRVEAVGQPPHRRLAADLVVRRQFDQIGGEATVQRLADRF